MFYFGIEHEVAFLNRDGRFADFSCTHFEDFNQIIEALPVYPDDYAHLRIGDAGIKQKRWYIEGFERLSDSDKVIDCIPKGIEIRTTIHSDIRSTIAQLRESFNQLIKTAEQFGFFPVLTSFNPTQTLFNPVLNQYEAERQQTSPEERTENIAMLTYGPDLNLSNPSFSTDDLIDIGRKLTFYSPFIVPFSFSSPFYNLELWSGFSVRTFERTGARPAALIFLENPEEMIRSNPSLTKVARLPAEIGRIEFKAFDSCADFDLYAALFTVLKGLILDKTLQGRSTIPDAKLHQISAIAGFNDPDIFSTAQQILAAVDTALEGDCDLELLTPLKTALKSRTTPAHQMIERFKSIGNLEESLRQMYPK
ncbi:MAG: glutamate--cysteine ligase [Leptolyngbya sp. Prado105]|nr:glutamate--cysteine ligase [Leptolyngbya sp. Prado105]